MQNEIEEHGSKSRFDKLKSIVWFCLRLMIAVAIIGYIIWRNHQELGKVFQQINYGWLVVALLFYLGNMLLSALRWKLLLEVQQIKFSFREVFSITMQCLFFSLIIPGGSVGGDLVKIGMISTRSKKGRRLEGILTILIDRIIGMVSLFSIAVFAFLISFKQVMSMNDTWKYFIISLAAACLLGLIATVVIQLHRQLEQLPVMSWCFEFGDKLSKGLVSRFSKALDLYKAAPKTLFICFLISTFGLHLNMVVISFFVLKGLGHPMVSPGGFMFSIVFGLVASLIPLTPSGIGAREAVMEHLLRLNGVGGGYAAALPLIVMSFIITFNFLGGLFFIFQPRRKKLSVMAAMADKATKNQEE